MAESQEEKRQTVTANGGVRKTECSTGNWWGSWIQAAKEKSSQTLELIKHDLNEFGVVCTQDASAAVSNTSDTLQQSLQGDGESSNAAYVKKGLTNFLGSISRVLTIPPDDESEDDVLRVTSNGGFEVFDKAKARLFEIQSSPQTYCTEPDGPMEAFKEWRQTFDLDSRKGEISDLLVSVDVVRSIYTKLVPSAVTHADFWQRYYYKVHQLEQDERRKDDLKSRADKLNKDDSEQPWEDDWEADESVEQIFTRSTTTKQEVAAPLSVELLAAPSPDSTTNQFEDTAGDAPPSPSSEHIQSIPAEISPDSNPSAADANVQPLATMLTGSESSEKAALCDANCETAYTSSDNSGTPAVIAEDAFPSDHATVKNVTDGATVTAEHPGEMLGPSVDEEAPAMVSKHSQLAEASSPDTDLRSSKEVGDTMTPRDFKMKEKRDLVILTDIEVKTPASSIGSANSKESSSGLDDEWDKEMFGEDLSTVREILAEGMTGDMAAGKFDDVNDDWETWD
ncbi:BSD domain-containing protein 1-like isoform X2 [Watersipora subatra]|uniref:BSD domain-containing protein 1-like isoform X2 n=1 Tax=Watersipora subatra TaxID=2589382 RepID=UPI00355B1229